MQRTLIVGTGSIGRRHVDNLLPLGAFSHRGGANAAASLAGAFLEGGIRSLWVALACHRSADRAYVEHPVRIPDEYVPVEASA